MTGVNIPLIEKAIESRQALFETEHLSAFQLFNGLYEDYPDIN